MNKKNGLSLYHQRKAIDAFGVNLTATVLYLNRNTVNRCRRLFREATRDRRRRMEVFRGAVEVDESEFGGLLKSCSPKQPVLGVIERGG